MNLVLRGVAADPASAALAMAAALRALEAVGVDSPAVWIAHGTARFDATAAWDHRIALVRVQGPQAEASARAVAEAVGARVVMRAADLGRLGSARGDGARLAARHELGLWPDEEVEVLLGADVHLTVLAAALEALDEHLATDPGMPRRLVLAGLSAHGPRLREPMIRAILHPHALVEVARSDPSTMALLETAADVVTPAG